MWIKASEAPHNIKELVFCLGSGGTPFVCYRRKNRWYRQSGHCQIVGITHFMYKPELKED